MPEDAPKIGDKITIRPSAWPYEQADKKNKLWLPPTVKAVVAYVNHAHRWFMVEWDCPAALGGKNRECLKF